MGKLILIIQNDYQCNYILTYLLHTRNYEIINAYCESDGLDKAKELKPNAILLDNKISDYLSATYVKENMELKDIPIILINSQQSKLEGADDSIEMPINADLFMHQVESILNR